MQMEEGKNIQQQIKYGYERATYHSANHKILAALMNLYNTAYNQFKDNPDKTCQMVGVKGKNTTAETAALIVVANAILNLDEVLTKN